MKILVVGHLPKELGGNFTTGVGNVVANLNRQFSKAHTVFLLATNAKFPSVILGSRLGDNHFQCSLLTRHTVFAALRFGIIRKEIAEYGSRYGVRTFKSILYRIALEGVIKANNFDLIHFHGVSMLPSFNFIGCKIPFIVTFHGVFYNKADSFSEISGLNTSKLYCETSKTIANATFLNDEMRDYALDNLAFHGLNSRVIHNGVACDTYFFDAGSRRYIRQMLGVGKGIKLLITIGTVQLRKGQRELIEANERELIRGDWKYLIVGKGPDWDELKEYVLERQLDGSVFMPGYLPSTELFKYYSAADFYILPSTSEGMPLVCLEALATGLPVLYRNELGSILNFAELGSHIKPFDIRKSISNLFFEYSREEICEISRRVLNWEQVGGSYLDLFEEVKQLV